MRMFATPVLRVVRFGSSCVPTPLSSDISFVSSFPSICDQHHLRMAHSHSGKHFLCMENLNPYIKKMEYAVRGPLVIRAVELIKELEQGAKKPFKEVIRANIGDCHAMGQKPITFLRQVLALVVFPDLMNDPSFPSDAKQRAKRILAGCSGMSAGSYSDSSGIAVIRSDVAAFITERDGHPSDPENIFLCGGASDGIRNVIKLLNCTCDGKPPGIMIPIPQYPLYSASLAEFNIHDIGYYLDEDNKWALNIAELQRAINEARNYCSPRAIVVINPGNPTGQVLTRSNIEEIIKFAHKEGLFILADEVYQDNVYDPDSKYYSFKKVMMELGAPYNTHELASFHSTSKGFLGECGLRGGYSEIINMDPEVMVNFKKSISAKLCPTVLGQAAMGVLVNRPKEGEPSYSKFIEEKTAILKSLNERATMVVETFNKMEGFKCNPVMGAMYAFPRFSLPAKAIDKAKSLGQTPDFFYAMQLLENTGICIVPGSGFGQREGTYHFRTTILPPVDKMEKMLKGIQEFHVKFLNEYK